MPVIPALWDSIGFRLSRSAGITDMRCQGKGISVNWRPTWAMKEIQGHPVLHGNKLTLALSQIRNKNSWEEQVGKQTNKQTKTLQFILASLLHYINTKETCISELFFVNYTHFLIIHILQ